ncbi:SDR family oxidoreductase [Nakamurella lactea]|uniref:SDR family oxidoreductase n=1 Tax=Nakamurella lactea TaxID=459515 RepID=UPI00048CFC70|nr:SDR family oxidoreductase [Nakamurella lactea]
MTDVGIIGGHGKVALLLEPLLIQAGHQVTGIIRRPDQAGDVAATGATPVVADIERRSTAEIAELIGGFDALVWSAGAGGGNPERTWAVDRDAAIRSIDAAGQAGVDRYLMVSYFGAGAEHGVPPEDSFYPYAEAKSLADAHLAGTELGWTILRPSGLTPQAPTGRIETGDGVQPGSVSRGNVAAVIAASLDLPSTIGRTIEFNDGAIPIRVALG